MKTTNIRINNNYILINNSNFYLTDIDQYNALEEEENLDKFLNKKPITKQIKELLDEFNFNIEDKVNFIINDGEYFKLKKNTTEDPLKIIQIKKDNNPFIKDKAGSDKGLDKQSGGG